jgi:hypothetical protein
VSAFALDAGIVILRDITKVLGGAASTAGNSFALRAAASMDDVTGAKMDYPGLGRIGSLSRVIHYGLAFDGKMHPTPHLGPLFAFSALFERSDAVHGPTVIYSAGLEITAAGILSLRIGNYNHSSDALDSATFGIGVSLDFLGLPEGARIDYAKRPEIGDLDQPDTISVILSSSRF